MSRAWTRHSGVLRTAASLLGTTIVTSGLGFVFWWTAARLLSPTAVGHGSAAVNVMTFVGTVGMLGLGTMLIGELRSGSTPQPGLVNASLIVTGLASALIALATILVMAAGGIRSFDVTSFLVIGLFTLGAALTGVAFVVDLALVGAGAGTLQLVRNAVFATVKWLLLYALLPAMPDSDGSGLLVAWVAGFAISVVVLVSPSARRRFPGISARPDWAALRSLRGATLAHNAFNMAGQMPRLLLPVMATSLISPAAGAVFFIAWMIASFLYIVPTHLSTALFAIGAGRLEELAQKLRFSFRLSLVLGVVGGPALAVLAPVVLRVFGEAYSAEGAGPLRLLCLAYLPMVVKTHYVAVVRVQRNLVRGSVVALLGAVLELVGAAVGALVNGVSGLCIGVIIGLTVEAVIMLPTLLRAGLWRTGHAANEAHGPVAEAPLPHLPRSDGGERPSRVQESPRPSP